MAQRSRFRMDAPLRIHRRRNGVAVLASGVVISLTAMTTGIAPASAGPKSAPVSPTTTAAVPEPAPVQQPPQQEAPAPKSQQQAPVIAEPPAAPQAPVESPPPPKVPE